MKPVKVISSAVDTPVVVRRAPSTVEQLWHELSPVMCRLTSRWLDECQFEDIDDYKAVIAPFVKERGGEILQMLRRPFGFVVKLNDRRYKITMSAGGKYTLSPGR